jgi:hypothetical protein
MPQYRILGGKNWYSREEVFGLEEETPCQECEESKWLDCYFRAKACDELWAFLARRGDRRTLRIKILNGEPVEER